MTNSKKISNIRLKELLYYNKYLGIFTRKTPTLRLKVNDTVGCIGNHGYVVISLEGKVYLAQRLAWFYEYGEWPTKFIDHRSGVKYHNWISNLRDVSKSENNWNQKLPSKNNTSGYLGVSYSKQRKKYMASITVNNVLKRLGYFLTPEEAYQVYVTAKRELHSTCTI